jgi:hypothetical protein
MEFTKPTLICAAFLLVAGCAGVDQVGPEVPAPAAAVQVVESAAANQMKDPDSAHFRNVHAFQSQKGLIICGEINAKNAFGGYVGYSHFVGHASADGRLLTPAAVLQPGDTITDAIWKSYYPGCY